MVNSVSTRAMCGIAGIINRTNAAVDPAMLNAMTRAVSHRGPDDAGNAITGPVGLGHRRLSIVDLSTQGAQPMHDTARGLTIIHNGEIYNYPELRAELVAKGYLFHSNTDTEVILAAYDAWGEGCVQHFNGMWAFAIYDANRQQVFCSRDRFGVKPFYYTVSEERFAFGSEIRQLLPLLPAIRANREVLDLFLVTGASDVDERTFFEGVLRLPAGHSLTYDLKTHSYHVAQYYSLGQRRDVDGISREEATHLLRETLRDAIRIRLRSDVKVGTCLSGGLDSSSIATLAASMSPHGPFTAITAVSEQESNNEVAFAEMVALHSKLDWYQVKPSYSDFANAMPEIARTQEEPFASASIVMQYYVMQTAQAQGIRVLLDGQGADEILLGYERYAATRFLSSLKKGHVLQALREYQATCCNNARLNLLTLAKFILGVSSSFLRYTYYQRQHRHLIQLKKIPFHLAEAARACADATRLQALDLQVSSVPVLLRYEDKNSMAFGVETRLPFLDYRLVELALALPIEYKIHQGWTKWILRNAMRDLMPESITWRKNKFGFEAPEELWMKQHNDTMRALVLASPLLRSLATPEKLGKHFDGAPLRSRFRLYSVAMWEQAFKVQL